MLLEEYQKLIGSKSFDNILSSTFKLLEEKYGNYEFFYAKNALNDDKDTLYFFYQKHIITVEFDENYQNAFLAEYQKECNKKYFVVSEAFDQPKILKVELSDGIVFEFNSHKDANNHWQNKYNNKVIELFKYL